MPGSHARCSASSADRWLHCPGSIALSDQCPPPKSSPYAAEGTLAHSIAEIKLRRLADEISIAEAGRRLKRLKQDPLYTAEMDEATDYYLDRVQEAWMDAGDNAELMVEQHFSLERWVPEGFGTSDTVIASDHGIRVIDLKYGTGVRVDAEGNPQLRLYGLGAVSLFEELYDIDTVTTTVIQPRLDHFSSETLPLQELLRWADEVVKPTAAAAMAGCDTYAAGDWCRFCPAKHLCRAQTDANLELARMEFRKPPLLTDEEIGEVLRQADRLTRWAEDISRYALGQALAGKHYDGWKLVEGRSVRQYADTDKVADALTAAGYDEAMLYERKLYGITAMEKVIGKKKLAETLGELIVKPAGKPVLVPQSDKRREINTAEAARADFENMEE